MLRKINTERTDTLTHAHYCFEARTIKAFAQQQCFALLLTRQRMWPSIHARTAHPSVLALNLGLLGPCVGAAQVVQVVCVKVEVCLVHIRVVAVLGHPVVAEELCHVVPDRVGQEHHATLTCKRKYVRAERKVVRAGVRRDTTNTSITPFPSTPTEANIADGPFWSFFAA